ncbi:MAG: TaqI-like C-terminal specificity domain-containing protein [Spirochaetales bacterium]|nr:TaqI-like C-terminal specificity domain-containing protein [Spirochaetales bacterium]
MSEFREIFENNYTDSDTILKHLIKPVFGDKIKSANMSIDIDNQDKGTVNNIVIFATLGGSIPVNFVDVTLNDKIKLHHNKVSIQRCVRKIMDTLTSSLIFFHYENPENRSWRITFVNKGENNKEFTDSKRYTYLCGMNYSCRTADERFTKLQKEIAAGNKILDELMIDCFDVEPLSNEFFEKYREHYADLVEYISGKRFVKKGGKFIEEKTKNANGAFKDAFSGDDKAVRDYVKKMMGRLVFLQFLQKKGWLGVEEGKPWGTGDRNFIFNLFKNAPENIKKDFLESALEPLFFNSLNNDRGKEAIAPESICNIYGKKVRIPYLNGGLFEEDELDKKKVKFKKEHFEALLEFFNQYNFTIDETDPDDTEIGVDPEMLGKIFENLLEDNKDKGAFYTPKEIVQYMCRESLIAYLLTDSKISDDKIRDFVINHNCSLNESEKADILKALLNVKVCDPAVGSGAFPMGMLNELISCTQLLTGESKTRAELKKHIVKNNIYGVDIEKGAVDIARLRFWLAIIVDEENPLPLPNLDYKIMQGNSLLESFEGIDLSNLCKVEKGALFSAEKEVNTLVTTLSHYFDTQNHEERDAHRTAIREAVYDLLKARNCGNDNDVITKLKKIDLHENNQFFLWHTWFSDVFNRRNDNYKNGFDIVIGNPPYVNVQLMSESEKSIYKETFETFFKRCDMFALFVELGISILAQRKGIVSFIIPSVVHSNMSYVKLRDLILNNKWLREVCYTGGDVFNAPTVDTTILICDKTENQNITLKNAVDFNNKKIQVVPSDYFSKYENVISIENNQNNSIYDKLLDKKLESIDDNFTVFQGIVTGNNDAFIFDSESDAVSKCVDKELLHPLCHGRDIEKYKVRSLERRILYIDNSVDIEKYPNTKKWLLNYKAQLEKRREAAKGTINWYGLQWARVKSELDLKEKILLQNTRNESMKIRLAATLDDSSVYASQGINFLIPKTNKYNLHFLLGILNSKLLNFLFATKFLNLAIKAEYVKQVRIPTVTKEQQQEIISLVDEILEAKKTDASADTTELEKQIDQKVYKLYGLNPGEINIVENMK